MDTTKSSREEAARRPRQEAPRNPRPQAGQEAPQRRVRQGEAPQQERPVRQRREVPQQEQPARQRREASQQEQPTRQRQEASQQEQAASQRRQASQKKAPEKTSSKQVSVKRRQKLDDDVPNRKRTYGKTKPKKKTTLSLLSEMVAAAIQENMAIRKARQESQGKNKRTSQHTPAVIYTQPQAFNRNRLLIQLITVTAVVVAFVVGISVFFKVGKITVAGAEVYTNWSVQEASGIQEGDNLLTFSRARAGALIKANLPYVKNVSFGIKLPDTVNIIIEEEDVVYAIKDQDEGWWLMNSNGRIVEQTNGTGASKHTQVLGVALQHPLQGEMAVAVEAHQSAEDATEEAAAPQEETVPAAITASNGAQRLATALQILKALEANDIVGSAASINVTQTQSITLWYGTRYQVNLGDTANLDYKITCMNDTIMELSDYQSGILDISFTIWPNQVGYTPFA